MTVAFGEGARLAEVGAFLVLGRHLARERSNLTAAHFFSTKLILLGPLLARVCGVRSIITITGFGRIFSGESRLYRLLRRPYRALFRLAILSSTLVLFQNRGDLEVHRRLYRRHASKFRYIGSATEEVAVTPKSIRLRSEQDGPLRVITVARLLESKGIIEFIEIARKVDPATARFVLVGAPSKSEPQTQVAVVAAAAAGFIEYLGPVDFSALRDVYQAAHVILFLSHGEGMARVLLEAGMHGLCPVVYDIPANRDLVAEGRGFIVPLGDVSSAEAAIRELACARDMLAQLAERFHEWVRMEFSVRCYVDRYEAALVAAGLLEVAGPSQPSDR